ncbi:MULTISPECIES: response regulator transcription factor [Cupriavidus]|uniref:response regulator transcription factor n=1 Tax=Cupriavidus TaxID=106589 RepID=UPI00037382B7|nr:MULTISPECIES: response regulator transcription factor [Cupriavidus]
MKVALLDANPASSQPVAELVTGAGFPCHCYEERAALIRDLRDHVFDMILVAGELPDGNGTEVVRMIRCTFAFQTPVIVVSPGASHHEIMETFAAGADDYCCALRPAELLARMVSHYRRHHSAQPSRQRLIHLGDYVLNIDRYSATLRGKDIRLTPKEFGLAWLLFSSPSQVLPRNHIETMVWGHVLPAMSRALAALIARLRRVLELRSANGITIASIHALGYRLDVQEAAPAGWHPAGRGAPGDVPARMPPPTPAPGEYALPAGLGAPG